MCRVPEKHHHSADDAANDCNGCFEHCDSDHSVSETAGCADTMGGHDIAGLGRACADAGDTSACVAGGRINGNSHGTGT